MRYLGKVASILSLRADLEHVYVSRFSWLIYCSAVCKVAGAVKGILFSQHHFVEVLAVHCLGCLHLAENFSHGDDY